MPILTLTMVDAYGRQTNRRYEMETQVDILTYQGVSDAFVAALQAVTDLGLVRADLILQSISSGFAVTAGANVDVGATFSGYLAAGGGKKASMRLPGVKASLVDPDGSVPIAGVTATWLAEFETAGDFQLSDGETIDSWIRGALDK